MAAGTFTISGLSASEPSGERVFGPTTITGTQVVGETLAVPLGQGDNTFAIPAGAVAAWIQAPVNGSVTLTLRTNLNQNDAGMPINGTGAPTIYPFPVSAPGTLIVNSSGPQASPLTIAFI
jgi:hypothetical protein